MPWTDCINAQTGPKVYKTFFMLNSAKHEIFSANKFENANNSTIVGIFIFIAEKFSCSAMFSKKEFAIFSYLIFISMKNFMLSWVEHEKKFYNLRARFVPCCLHMSEDTFSPGTAHIIIVLKFHASALTQKWQVVQTQIRLHLYCFPHSAKNILKQTHRILGKKKIKKIKCYVQHSRIHCKLK